jgi:YbbR domain-containing protein
MENKRYHIIIASVIFAVAMWISINMGYEYTVVKYVPVVVENLKEGHVLKYPVPKFMTVRFKGTGWQLASVYLSPNVKYYIDAQTLTAKRYIVTGKDLPEHVKLPLAVQALEVIPDSLALAVDEYSEKRVPVISRISIVCMDGYGQVGPIHVTPESVVVSGSRVMIDGITEWSTLRRRFDKQRTPINEDVPVEESPTFSVEVFPQTIHYQVDIEHFAEKTFSGIPLNTLGVPPNREIIFIPPKMDIIVRGGIDQLAKLTNDDFLATVDYNTIVRDSSGVVVPALNSPQMVQVIRKAPEQFQFIIRKKL